VIEERREIAGRGRAAARSPSDRVAGDLIGVERFGAGVADPARQRADRPAQFVMDQPGLWSIGMVSKRLIAPPAPNLRNAARILVRGS
jgi:hypothetical protein